MSAAKEHNAKKFASGLWYKANRTYQKAQNQYNFKEYDEASDSFSEAAEIAEKAELKARVKKQKLGEVF